MALTWVRLALGAEAASHCGAALDERWPSVLSLVDTGRAPLTTSVGRLFDAAAALLGIRPRVTYEGQAAIELEALARRVTKAETPSYPVELRLDEDGWVLDPAPLVAAILAERQRGVPAGVIAAGFHAGLATGAARLAAELCRHHGLDTVALSGGVFQNVRLTDLLAQHLKAAGLRVLTHERIPANDGGISIGQAAIAAS